MTTDNMIIIGKYVLNNVNKDKFNKLMNDGVGHKLSDSYLKEKWEAFYTNQLSFLVCYKEFTEEVIKEIKKTNYKG